MVHWLEKGAANDKAGDGGREVVKSLRGEILPALGVIKSSRGVVRSSGEEILPVFPMRVVASS